MTDFTFKYLYKIYFVNAKIQENERFCQIQKLNLVHVAYIEYFAKNNNGVKYLLVLQDLFDRTVNAKEMKTKDSQKTVKAFPFIITKRNWPKKFWLKRRPSMLERLKKFRAAEGIQVYSTTIETKAAFAQRTITSLENILYRYMEDYPVQV